VSISMLPGHRRRLGLCTVVAAVALFKLRCSINTQDFFDWNQNTPPRVSYTHSLLSVVRVQDMISRKFLFYLLRLFAARAALRLISQHPLQIEHQQPGWQHSILLGRLMIEENNCSLSATPRLSRSRGHRVQCADGRINSAHQCRT